MKSQGTLKASIHCGVAVESDESEATRPASVLVHHQRCVNHATELLEEVLEVLLGRLLTDTTNKDFAGSLLLLPGNCPLRVDLLLLDRIQMRELRYVRSCHQDSAP